MSDTTPNIVVLGGGPAGLGAAYRLAERKLAKVTVLEAGDRVGGNAGSFEWEGLHLDYGSHRLHPACDPALLEDLKQMLGADLLVRPRHGRICLKNRWIRFPLKPLDLACRLPPTFALGVAGDTLRKALPGRSGSNGTFASVLRGQLGETICREFYFPYARKIWGRHPEAISATQAQKRVSANSVTKLVKKVLSANRQGKGCFYYPKRGFGQISETISRAAKSHGADVRLNSRVLEVRCDNGAVTSVTYENGTTRQSIAADYVWSTIPIAALLRSLSPTPEQQYLEAAAQIKLRSMLLIYLVLETDQFSEFDAHYFPGADIPITRLSEPKNYSASQEPRGATALCAELPCDVTDKEWGMPDVELGQLVLDSLKVAGIPVRAPVRQVLVRRIPHAYPIYENGFERHFRVVDEYVNGIDRLLTFGRQGLFVHDNTHHALFMAYSAARCLDGEGQFDQQQWREYRRAFEAHVVED